MSRRSYSRDTLLRLSRADQERAFIELALENPISRAILERASGFGLADWYLVSGCLFQTVWNLLSGFPPTRGIKDYDLFYFEDGDLSWAAEDVVIRWGRVLFSDLDAEIEIRNQARVHLWYEAHFGQPYAPLRSSAEGIDRFLSTSAAYGIRQSAEGEFSVHAPFGYQDLYGMVVRPNYLDGSAEIYYAKAERWRALWPDLVVLRWPSEEAKRA